MSEDQEQSDKEVIHGFVWKFYLYSALSVVGFIASSFIFLDSLYSGDILIAGVFIVLTIWMASLIVRLWNKGKALKELESTLEKYGEDK